MEAGNATGKGERIAVLFLCLLGAAHVFIFSAAFPFFSVVDEQVHFDLVVRYAHGGPPRSLTPPDTNALPFIAIYGTPEYLSTGGRIPPPPWKQPVATVRAQLLAKEAGYQQVFKNHEAASPPLYYLLAGGWWRLGQGLHLDGAPLLYWLRFLNVPLVALLVWLAWLAARHIFPENAFIRFAVPALVACLPQASFYAINNDVLVPLTFGAAFLLVVKLVDTENPAPRLAVAAGLALAAAGLTKTSNMPLLAAAGVFLGAKLPGLLAKAKSRPPLLTPLVLVLAAAVPLGAWMIWCKLNFGDFTGSSAKIQFLGWTSKSPAEWLNHPLFTWAGGWFFIKQNLATFWQGEMLWQHRPLAMPGVDAAYAVLSLGACALTLAALLRRPPPYTTGQRSALRLAFLCAFFAFAFFAWLSIKFDFQDCFYPSREHPFFVSGRLLLGLLVPFLILFAAGLDRLTKNFTASSRYLMLVVLLGFMLAAEITVDWPVFGNDYNWFHL